MNEEIQQNVRTHRKQMWETIFELYDSILQRNYMEFSLSSSASISGGSSCLSVFFLCGIFRTERKIEKKKKKRTQQ